MRPAQAPKDPEAPQAEATDEPDATAKDYGGLPEDMPPFDRFLGCGG